MFNSPAKAPEVVLISDYNYKNIKGDLKNVEKLSTLDKRDFKELNYIFFNHLIKDHLGFDLFLSCRETTFESVMGVLTQDRVEYELTEESKQNMRDMLSSLMVGNQDPIYQDVERINVSLINNKQFNQFVTYKLNAGVCYIILHPGFLNLLLKDPACVILLLLEGLFNYLVKNYGENIMYSGVSGSLGNREDGVSKYAPPISLDATVLSQLLSTYLRIYAYAEQH